MGFSRQEYQNGLPFPSPVDHRLSELSTMTRLSWVALHSKAYSFIELDKAVVHVIRLVSFLSLWLSVIVVSVGLLKKQESSRKTSISALLTMPKPLTVWITTNWKILKEMGIPDHLTCLLRNLYAGRKKHLELDMEQHTGSK